jgi:hypothetical protein
MVSGAPLDSVTILASVVYVLLAGVIGILFMALATFIVPHLVDRMTPRINDEKEIAKGNLAVATYVGQITQAVIIGMSIIVAAAVIAGIL